MTIAIDADDMGMLRKRLTDASAELAGAAPTLPSGDAFGSAVLAGAVASFDAAVRRDAARLRERWAELDVGVRAALTDMTGTESRVSDELDRLHQGLA